MIKKSSKKEKKLKIVDLFCGIGGFHLGSQMAFPDSKIKCVWACDIDETCREAYKANFDVTPHGDILTWKESKRKIKKHDILFAGFPCQPFSVAGKKLGMDDPRFDVFDEILSIVKEHSPKLFVLENVKNLEHISKGNVFKIILDKLTALDYKITHFSLNTSQVGLPQNRERLFIVGSKTKEFVFNAPRNIDTRSLREFLTPIRKNEGREWEYIEKDKTYVLEQYDRKKSKSGLIFCGFIYPPLKNGKVVEFKHDPLTSRAHQQCYRVYDPDGVMCATRASDHGMRYYIYDEVGVRKLTEREVYRINGFPTTFKMYDKSTTSARHIGNSVSPTMVSYILKEMKDQGLIKL